jgi:hypothetical protein
MSAGTAPSPSGNRWKELYNAALFESDKNKLSERIANAEWALALRARELFHTGSEHLRERQAVDSAINALYALRMATSNERRKGTGRGTAA